MKSSISDRALARLLIAALCAFSLSGCIDSSSPILVDAEPVFGKQLRLQVYTLRDGFGRDGQQANYRWNGGLYARAGAGIRGIDAFSVHPFEAGDSIIQSVPSGRVHTTEYALLHPLAGGLYQIVPLDPNDADEQTRLAYCKRADKSACRIETREQLFAFARFTAARRKDNGGLAIRLPDGGEPRDQRRRR